jgi:hypothetical protein
MTAAPSRNEVRETLRKLLSGELSRQEVSRWAHTWVAADRPEVADGVVWTALKRLGGADLRAGPDDFLYFEPDFHAWLDEVESASDSPE